MRLSSLLLAVFCATAVLVLLLLGMGVNFRQPVPAQGADLYNPAREVIVKGAVAEVRDFACPVSEGEIGTHVMLKTPEGVLQVHLAPGRIMRSQKLSFAAGDEITVIGWKARVFGNNDLVAREITRGNEQFVFRDQTGKLMLVQ